MSGLHYCVHRPDDRRFIWLYDTKRLLAQVDEGVLREQVKRLPDLEMQRLFCESARLTCTTFDLPVPDWASDKLQRERKSYYLRDDRTPFSDLVQRVREFPTWSERVGYLRVFLAPSASFIRENFGGDSNLDLALGYLRFWYGELRTKLLRR